MAFFKPKEIIIADETLMAERDEAQTRVIELKCDLRDAREEVERLKRIIESYFAAQSKPKKQRQRGTAAWQRRAREEGYLTGGAICAIEEHLQPKNRCFQCEHARRKPGRLPSGSRHQATCAIHVNWKINVAKSFGPHQSGGWCPDFEMCKPEATERLETAC